MKEIEDIIKQLIEISNQRINKDDREMVDRKTSKMEDLIHELRKLSCSQQTILGRMILFTYSDKYSYYIITEINEGTVTIECLDLYDGFVDISLGNKSQIDRMKAECYIRGVDSILRMFPNKSENDLGVR